MNYLTLAYLALSLPPSLALPRPINICEARVKSYTVTSQDPNLAGSPVVGDYTVGGGGGLTDGSSYSVGVTVSIGANLGLDFEEIAESAGLDGSVATTTTKGTSRGVTGSCPPGPWSCSLCITPQMITVSGFQKTIICGEETAGASPYTITMPQKSSDNLVHAAVDICTCPNFPGSAAPGHPGLLCPQDCPE